MHEIPYKALAAVVAAIAVGMTILLVDPFSDAKSKNSAPPQSKAVRQGEIHDEYQTESFGGPGFPGSDPEEPSDRSAGRMIGMSSNAGDSTNNPAVARLRGKFEDMRAIRKRQDRNKALLEYGRELARTDPAGGLALIKAMASEFHGFGHGHFMFGGSDIGLVCQGFFEVSAQSNINTAIAMALELPRQLHRDGLGTVMKTWANSDLSAAIAYIDKLPADYARHGVESVFAVWGGKDPGAALSGSLKFGDPSKPETWMMVRTAVSSAMDGWSEVDPKAAWDYMLKPDDALKGMIAGNNYLFSMIAAKWAGKDLDAAMAAVSAVSGISDSTSIAAAGDNNSAYQNMVSFMTMRLLDTDPVAAGKLFDREKWLAGNPWLSSRNVTRLINEGSVSEAADWMTRIPDKNVAFDCARQIASRQTRSDYDAVFKWASMIQDDYVKAGALSNVAVEQAQHQINRPVDWIYDLPAGYSKDRSVAGYTLGMIRRTGDRDLEAILREQMSQPQINMAMVTQVIGKSKVDQQQKNLLLNLVEGRRQEKLLVVQ